MAVRIDYKGEYLTFRDDMSLKDFDNIKSKFTTNNGMPNISKPNWWYEKSPFALFVVKKLCLNPSIDYEIKIETKEEWREFYPLFKHYFPTMNEYIGIKNNVAFWNGRSDRVLEDSFYIKWVILHKYGLLTYDELNKMPFKETTIMYYYAMLNNMFEKAENFSKVALTEMRKDMEKETSEIYR